MHVSGEADLVLATWLQTEIADFLFVGDHQVKLH